MATPSGSPGSNEEQVLSGKRVLIVEDETIILMQLQKIVHKADMVIAGVTRHADTAIDLVKAERPDIVLMDVGLQGDVNGIEAAIQLQKYFHCCVVLCTAQSQELLGPALAAGVCGVIQKPFTFEVVIEDLSRLYGEWSNRPSIQHESRRSHN